MEELKKIASGGEGRIILALLDGEKKWNELLELTGLSKKGLAKHLKRLIEKGVVNDQIDKRDRRVKIYSLNPDLTPENVIQEMLTIILLKKLAIEFMELDIKAMESGQDLKKEIYNLIGRHYFSFSLENRGREILLKSLRYLAIGWNYAFENYTDEEIEKWLDEKAKGGKEKLLKEGTWTLREILEEAYIYSWIAQHGDTYLDEIKKIGLKYRKKSEVVEKVIRNIQLIHENSIALVRTLEDESIVKPIIKILWERVEKELKGKELEYIEKHIIKELASE